MNQQILITLVVVIVAIGLFIWNRLAPSTVALCVALALYVTGVVPASAVLAGLGDQVVIYIAALFVVSEALDATGVTAWLGRWLTDRAGTGRRSITVAIMLLVAVLTALISVNGAVAALVPMVVVLAIRTGLPTSQLMVPLAFGGHAGSLLALTGSPVNLIVSDFAVSTGNPAFGFFSFALMGIPLLIGTIAICVWLGPRGLPHRTPASTPRDLSEHARTLAEHYGLPDPDGLVDRTHGLIEVVVSPRSRFIGRQVGPGVLTADGRAVIQAVQRNGRNLDTAELLPGDVLLLRGSWSALEEYLLESDVIVVDPPAAVRRQAVPMGAGAVRALVVVAGMIVLMATGLVPAPIAALIAAVAMVLLRVISAAQAHRSVSLPTLLLVGGMIPLSTAITTSGAAALISQGLVDVLGNASPYLLLFGIVLVVAVLGQLISNAATVLIVAPIAIAIAGSVGISPVPLLMAVAVAGAAAFLTPIATPANTMVYGPGGYRFGDYWRLGFPCLVLFVLAATFLVPVFWPF